MVYFASNGSDVLIVQLHFDFSQLWPVQSGSRVAAIPIGKGCRLLYASHGSFTSVPSTSESDASVKLPSGVQRLLKDQETLPRVRDTLLILFPDGKIATVTVPFPALVR